MTATQSLSNARDFFDAVVKPSHEEFVNTPSSFRTAFNAVTALFHMHEWIFEFHKAEIDVKFGQSFAKAGAFWGHVETLVPQAGFVRDLTNASKHVRLTLNPSTSMSHIANTVIQSVGYCQGGYGMGRYSAPTVTMKDGANDVSLDTCAAALFAFWQTLIDEIAPTP